MATQKFKLFEADIDVDGVIKKSIELKDEIIKQRQEMKLLKVTVGENNEEYIIAEARLKKVRAEYNLNQKQVQNLTDTNGKLLTVQQKLDLAIKKEVKTVKNAIKNNKELRTLRNDIDVTTREGAEAVEILNAKIDENTELIKDNSSALEKLKLNIGNYKEDIKGAFDEINILNGGLSGFIERSNQAGGAGKLVESSVKGMTKGFIGLIKSTLAFIATPIGAILAALVLVFALVKNAMNRSEEATNKINKIFAIFSGIINKLLKALEPLGEFLIDGIVLGFELAAQAADKAIGIISSGLKLLGFKDAAESVENWYGEIKEGVKAAQDLVEAEAKLVKEQRTSQRIQLEYQRTAEKLRQIRDDESLSIKERIAANEELGKVLQEQLADELRIVNLALEVANLRIQAEGETRDALDEQAEALNTIAEIQERITSQESEQLVNRVSLQKEAADKARELADEAIAQQQAELDLYIAQQGLRAKTLKEQLVIATEVYKRDVEILKANLKNRNLTQTEFDAQLLEKKNELLLKQRELGIDNAKRELEDYVSNHQQKIDADLFFSEESLRVEQERLNSIANARREFEEERLNEGIISTQEYNDNINAINEENRLKLEEAQFTRDEAKKEKEIVDLENKRILDEEKFTNEFELLLAQEDIRYKAEIKAAKKSGADTDLIEKQHAVNKKKIQDALQASKISSLGATLDVVAKTLGKESALGKAAALAQALINTYQGITAGVKLGYPAAIPAVAAAVVTGFANVKKITSTKVPKAKRGAVFNIGGKRHSQGGTRFTGDDGTAFEAEKGEKMFVLNREASAALQPLLSKINQQYGGVSLGRSSTHLASGGQVLRSTGKITVPTIDYERLGQFVAEGARTGTMEGSYKGSAEGSMEGTRVGSAEGTYSGIVDRVENEAIEAGADF